MKTYSLFAIAGLTLAAGAAPAAVTIYGLTTRNQLVSWDATTPSTLQQAKFIRGMDANEAIINIDFRPVNGKLYALGSFGNLYTLNTVNAMATLVAPLVNSITGMPIQLDGVEFGFDFNPTVDRIRITSDQGMNLRANPLTGVTVVDSGLNNSGGGRPNIVGSAYTNSDTDPNTGTTLYNIDSFSDMLTIQAPPNNGTNTNVGALGVDVSALAGFDILTTGTMNTAYAALQPAGMEGSNFYTVNLATGAANLVGGISFAQGSDSLAIRDIAAVPEPGTIAAIGLGLGFLTLRRRRRA